MVPPITWAKMKKDDCEIIFEEYNEVCNEFNEYPEKTKTSNLIMFKYKEKDDILKLYRKLTDNNIKIFMEYKSTDYGSTEFGIVDPDENMIIISY